MITDKRRVIQFTETEDRHAKLLVRLEYDGLNKSEFFRAILTAYLDRNNDIMNFVDSYTEKKEMHSKKKRKESKELREESKETEKKFGLDNKDIENIFDIMEKEHPDL